MKLIEALGTGIQKMQFEISKYPEIELSMNETGNAFQVQFINTIYKEAYVEAHEEAHVDLYSRGNQDTNRT